MAAAQQEVTITAYAKDFEYEVGMWEKPATNDQPAKLSYADAILAKADVSSYALGDTGTAEVIFRLSKPPVGQNCFGWHDSQLKFRAILGNKCATFNGLGKMYHDMPPGKVSTFGLPLDLSGNTDPIHHKLEFILSDDVTTPKGGLNFHWAEIKKKY